MGKEEGEKAERGEGWTYNMNVNTLDIKSGCASLIGSSGHVASKKPNFLSSLTATSGNQSYCWHHNNPSYLKAK